MKKKIISVRTFIKKLEGTYVYGGPEWYSTSINDNRDQPSKERRKKLEIRNFKIIISNLLRELAKLIKIVREDFE